MENSISFNYIIVYNILSYYLPDVIDIDNVKYRDIKFLNRTWYMVYHYLFNKRGRKYFLINYEDFKSPFIRQFNLSYDKEKIFVVFYGQEKFELEYDDIHYGGYYIETEFRIYKFIKKKYRKNYGKSDCICCGKYEYCRNVIDYSDCFNIKDYGCNGNEIELEARWDGCTFEIFKGYYVCEKCVKHIENQLNSKKELYEDGYDEISDDIYGRINFII